jgi:hypothetical protein
MRDAQEFEQLEMDVHAMQWEHVSLEPDPADVQRADQELPAEWTQTLEPEHDTEYTPDELDDLLHSDVELPEGDIDANAEQALDQLDIDLDAIAQERDFDLEIDIQPEQGFDFGR